MALPPNEVRPGVGTGATKEDSAADLNLTPRIADSDPLDFLRHLHTLDVPIFTADPKGSDYARPLGWQRLNATGNAARIKAHRPGQAFAGLMGGKVAVVDVDTKNGADADRTRHLLDALNVTVYADVLTPSGGRHYYVAGHPDLPTVHAAEGRPGLTGHPGVEIISYGANVFLPGTLRAKYNGAPYVVLLDNLAALADGGDPDTGETLAAWVADNRAHAVEPFEPSAPWDGATPDKRQAAYLEAVVTNQCTALAGMGPNSGRNVALYTAALKCGSFVAGAGMDEHKAITALSAAAAACGLTREDGDESVAATIRSGLLNGRKNPRAVPADKAVTYLDGLAMDERTGEVLDGPQEAAEPLSEGLRRIILTSAADIKPRPVFWLWKGRLALGTLGLLAGREGLGKSTLGYWIAARITRGELYGHYHGSQKSVLVCATEDSWEHTIVPRLMAAGADLARVYRVDVVNALDIHVGLSLPRDLLAVEDAARRSDAALLLLDPLMSRLGDLDTHRDAEVRQALEPLVAIADRTNMSILGLIHHNKSGSADPLQLVMGSKAFTAVARSVHTVVPDPEDDTDTRRLFGTPKNNLGRTDLPTLTFQIESHPIDTDEGTAWTGRLEWGDELAESITDAMRRAVDAGEDRSATTEAAEWLSDYLAVKGGQVPSADAKKAGKAAGHSESAIKRAGKKLRLIVSSTGFPRATYWEMPTVGPQSGHPPRGDGLTELTDPTVGGEAQSGQLGQLGHGSKSADTTAPPRNGARPLCACHGRVFCPDVAA